MRVPRDRASGFTLVELMIGIVIVAVLASLAMPSFLDTLRNSEVRNAAESITAGMQRARAEAVSRNANVQFVLGAGSSWTVDYEIKPVPGDPPIDSRSSNEGSRNVTVTAVALDGATAATTIIFNSLGQPKVGVPATEQLARIDLAAPRATTSLRVTIGVGGNARMCDPALPAGSSTRAC